MQKRRCAVCGDNSQVNVNLLWRRDSDGTVFHVCLLCAETGKVNATSVNKNEGKSFTTYLSDVEDSMLPLRQKHAKCKTRGSSKAVVKNQNN